MNQTQTRPPKYGTILICQSDACGIEFPFIQGGLFYCSSACYGSGRTGKIRTVRLIKVCPICTKSFEVLPSNSARIYCGQSCATTGRNHARYGSLQNWELNWNIRARRFYDSLEPSQRVCGICQLVESETISSTNRQQRFHVDHCHDNKHIRGLLCQGCNTLLGKWQQKSEGILLYLQRETSGFLPRHLKEVSLNPYFNKFHAQQKNQNCWACNAKPIRNRLSVDHNHDTYEIRGILCIACNAALGFYERFGSAIASYLTNVVEGY